MTDRHRVFVSYHHENDEEYKRAFEQLFDEVFEAIIAGSVDIGDIDSDLTDETIRRKIRDEFLSSTTVTVVLVGEETWKRKHVDWEIAASLRATEFNPRSGLVGILLPTYPRPAPGKYAPKTIPPRLHDNLDCGYAKIYGWTEDPETLAERVHAAYLRRSTHKPDQGRPLFRRNRSGDRWS